MRILYLMTEPFGIGGVQSDILTLSEDLGHRGHEVFVGTMPGVLLEELQRKGAHYLELDSHFGGPSGLWRLMQGLRRAIREHAIEMLAPQSIRSTIAAYAATRLMPFNYRVSATNRRLPIVTTIHNIHNPVHFRWAGHILNTCADYVVFESNYERDRVLASGLGEARSVVIHSGIDTDKFVPQPLDPALAAHYGIDPRRHRVFGIVARLSEEKGHDILLRAFAEVHRTLPASRLMVIGDGPLLASVRAQAQSLGLTDAVIFTGMQRNIPQHLALLDAFVLASTRESFPLAAREAMAAGKPVIAPKIGGCPEVVDDGVTGYLFEVRNEGQLRDRMQQILDGGRHLTMGRAARERVERLFSRRSWVEGDEKVYLSWHKTAN